MKKLTNSIIYNNDELFTTLFNPGTSIHYIKLFIIIQSLN